LSWLIVLRPVREEMPFEPTEEEDRIVGEHFAYLRRLRAEGKLLVAGPSQAGVGDTFGIAVIDTEDEAEARAVLEADPAIVNGVMTGELRPFRIAVR